MPNRTGAPPGSNRGGGRRAAQIDLDRVKELARSGLNNGQIAAALGISETTLYRSKKRTKDFNAAIDKGRNEGLAVVANALVRNALGGNVTAQIFFLKCHGKWRDNSSDHSLGGSTESPLVIKLVQDGNSSNSTAE